MACVFEQLKLCQMVQQTDRQVSFLVPQNVIRWKEPYEIKQLTLLVQFKRAAQKLTGQIPSIFKDGD